MGALKPAARPAATPAATRAFWESGERPPRPATHRPILPPLSTLGPSGPSDAPLPRLRDAASRRTKGSLGAACTLPSAIAIRLGRLGPRSRLHWRKAPTAKPPSKGTSTTGQAESHKGRGSPGRGMGSGGGGGGGMKAKPPKPICSKAPSGVPVACTASGRGSGSGGVALNRLISPSTTGP